MAGRDELSPTIARLRALLSQCDDLKRRSRDISETSAHTLAELDKRIAECVAQLEGTFSRPKSR